MYTFLSDVEKIVTIFDKIKVSNCGQKYMSSAMTGLQHFLKTFEIFRSLQFRHFWRNFRI